MARRALIAVLLFVAACSKPEPDLRPDLLKAQLTQMRTAIKVFHRENGRYPHSLEELVPKYLRSIPRDPFTNSNETWRLTTEDIVAPSADFTTAVSRSETFVLDVHSGAGVPYSNW